MPEIARVHVYSLCVRLCVRVRVTLAGCTVCTHSYTHMYMYVCLQDDDFLLVVHLRTPLLTILHAQYQLTGHQVYMCVAFGLPLLNGSSHARNA